MTRSSLSCLFIILAFSVFGVIIGISYLCLSTIYDPDQIAIGDTVVSLCNELGYNFQYGSTRDITSGCGINQCLPCFGVPACPA